MANFSANLKELKKGWGELAEFAGYSRSALVLIDASSVAPPTPSELELLSPDECARGARISSPSRRQEWWGGRIALREVEKELLADPFGSGLGTELASGLGTGLGSGLGRGLEPGTLWTSLTHSRVQGIRWVLAAGARGGKTGIGVDLEASQRSLHPRLKDRIASHEERNPALSPIAIWAVKEALLKAERAEAPVVTRYRIESFDPISGRGVGRSPMGARYSFWVYQDPLWTVALACGPALSATSEL